MGRRDATDRVARRVCQKIAQNEAQFLIKFIRNFYRGKKVSHLCLLLLPYVHNFKQLPKVNSHLIGETSPNLVTLATAITPTGFKIPSRSHIYQMLH
jgi:hypothetical protein